MVYVCGVGCSEFVAPKTRAWNYPDMVKISVGKALADAQLDYNSVDALVASYCYGEPTSGQRAVYQFGLTGVPVFNVNNNCSSGSSALMLARHLIQSGVYQCVLAVGFEKMEGGLSEKYTEHTSPVDRHFARIRELGAPAKHLPRMNPMTSEVIRIFAYAAEEYRRRYPTTKDEDFAAVAVKNRRHGQQNPLACLYKAPIITESQAKSERKLCGSLTVHQCALTADGSAAAILCSSGFRNTKLSPQASRRCVLIAGQAMASDLPSSFQGGYIDLSGFHMSKTAAKLALKEAGVSIPEISVIELHDCFAPNELLLYEALGLAKEGTAAAFFHSGTWISNPAGGRVYKTGNVVVNPSGGLESKGHPIGATGIAQAHELVQQLRGEAEQRQVPGANIALQHNFGIGGAAVCTVYKRLPDARI